MLTLLERRSTADVADSIHPEILPMTPKTAISAPFERFEGEVLPEWID